MRTLGIALAFSMCWVLGCESDESCPSCPEGPDDTAPGDQAADLVDEEPDQETAPDDCRMGRVDCAENEVDLYGMCVVDARIPLAGGIFTMGTDDSDHPDATPAHSVTVSGFAMLRTEVSNAQYAACVGCSTCTPPQQDGSFSGREPYYANGEYDNHPVIFVTWEQAGAFCEGLGGRLPTEAEWEFAARGIEGRLYPWGNEAPDYVKANYDYAFHDTRAVDDHAPGATPEGILNLAGNVWEWVGDTHATDAYASSPNENPTGPEAGPIKVARGGSFGSDAEALKAFVRGAFQQTASYSNLGFRCVFPD